MDFKKRMLEHLEMKQMKKIAEVSSLTINGGEFEDIFETAYSICREKSESNDDEFVVVFMKVLESGEVEFHIEEMPVSSFAGFDVYPKSNFAIDAFTHKDVIKNNLNARNYKGIALREIGYKGYRFTFV